MSIIVKAKLTVYFPYFFLDSLLNFIFVKLRSVRVSTRGPSHWPGPLGPFLLVVLASAVCPPPNLYVPFLYVFCMYPLVYSILLYVCV